MASRRAPAIPRRPGPAPGGGPSGSPRARRDRPAALFGAARCLPVRGLIQPDTPDSAIIAARPGKTALLASAADPGRQELQRREVLLARHAHRDGRRNVAVTATVRRNFGLWLGISGADHYRSRLIGASGDEARRLIARPDLKSDHPTRSVGETMKMDGRTRRFLQFRQMLS